jgi:hypothetical protein
MFPKLADRGGWRGGPIARGAALATAPELSDDFAPVETPSELQHDPLPLQAPIAAQPAAVVAEEAPVPPAATAADDEELVRLEALLAERGAQLIAVRSELSRVSGLLRDAVERFEALPVQTDATGRGELERQREAAVVRAIEAEAARAELLLKLDELLGHLAEAGQGEGGLPGESNATTTARLAGTVRGLISARAELREERDALAARLMLFEHDLDHFRGLLRARERELAEAHERAELEQVTARSLAARLEGSVGAVEAAALREELSTARTRIERSERAADEARAARRQALEQAEVERERSAVERSELATKNSELNQGLAREIEKTRKVADELARAAAEGLVWREELTRARAEAASAREQATSQVTASLRDLRELLGGMSAAVERVMSGPSVTAAGLETESEPTEPGTPTFVQAIEGLEEQVSLRDQRIMDLSAQLGRERGRLSALHGALVALRADSNADSALAQRLDALLLHFGQSGSWRPPG